MTRRKPSQYNWPKQLFDETHMTKHYSPTRGDGGEITSITIHHMTVQGNLAGKALDTCWNIWQTREASAHYGVDGRYVRQYVWDHEYAWHSGNTYGNNHSIGIEMANLSVKTWSIHRITLETVAKLTAYLHVKHRLGRPRSGVTMRKHSSWKATACPGPWVDKNWFMLVKLAQKHYDEIVKPSGRLPAGEKK